MTQNPMSQPPYGIDPGRQPTSTSGQGGQQQPGQSYGHNQESSTHQVTGYVKRHQQTTDPHTRRQYSGVSDQRLDHASWFDPQAGPRPQMQQFRKKYLLTKPIYLLLIISAVFYVLNWILLTISIYLDVESSSTSSSQEGVSLGFPMFWVGLGLGLYGLTLFPIVNGMNWGRIVGVVMAPLGVIQALLVLVVSIELAVAIGVFSGVVTVAFMGVNIAWIVVAIITWEKPKVRPMYSVPVGWVHV